MPFFQLGTFARDRDAMPALVIDGEVLDLAAAASRAGQELPPFAAVSDLLGEWDATFDRLSLVADHALAAGIAEFSQGKVEDLRPGPPPGRVGKMLFAAANYSDHVRNMRETFTPDIPLPDRDKALPPLRPYMFGKVNAPTGAYDDIILPPGMERIDWEAELMVVIGRPGQAIRQSDAHRHIAGYMTGNDISCRDRTWREDRPTIRSDWLGGKSYDSFAPLGPLLTPRQFVPDHADLAVRLWVNGDLKQDGNSGSMTFGIEEQVEYASSMMTLLPGDVIATGTPAGTGQERGEFLKEGDLVEAEVELCGRQRNRVVARNQEKMA